MSNEIEMISTPEEVDMADDWYEFATPDHFWIKGRYNAIMRVPEVRNLSSSTLFEVGCGNGAIINQFEKLNHVTVDGCDLNMLALNQVRNNKGNLFCLNIFEKPADLLGKYDGVLLMDVIEHIDNDGEFLKTATQYVKPEGLVIINVPALNSLYSKYDKVAGHKRRYTKRMLQNLFNRNGIEKVSIAYWGFALLPIAVIRKLVLSFTSEQNIIQRGFKPPNKFMNKALGLLLSSDQIIKSPFMGTSLVAVGKLRKKE